jgi:hypothetical protein
VTTSGAEAAVARVRSMTGSYTAARRAEYGRLIGG